MRIETKRCLIRPFQPGDECQLYPILSDPEVMRYIEPVFTMEKTIRFIQEFGLASPPLIFALEHKARRKLIGHVIFHPYDEYSYEIGWILHRDYWGQGLADEVTKALIRQLKQLGISGCTIECSREHAASCSIARKNGFIFQQEENELLVFRLEIQ